MYKKLNQKVRAGLLSALERLEEERMELRFLLESVDDVEEIKKKDFVECGKMVRTESEAVNKYQSTSVMGVNMAVDIRV